MLNTKKNPYFKWHNNDVHDFWILKCIKCTEDNGIKRRKKKVDIGWSEEITEERKRKTEKCHTAYEPNRPLIHKQINRHHIVLFSIYFSRWPLVVSPSQRLSIFSVPLTHIFTKALNKKYRQHSTHIRNIFGMANNFSIDWCETNESYERHTGCAMTKCWIDH